jgi:FkbM family methyltransferase
MLIMKNFDFKNFSNKVVKNLKISLSPTSFLTYPKDLYLHHVISFSQEGEDRVLSRFFEDKNKGFYIDVGAHHPQWLSNTYYFYLKGWRGINIDAMPGSMINFNKIRPEDLNLEVAISNAEQELTYYEFNEPALNSFDKVLSEERDKLDKYKITTTHTIKTCQLSDILDKYLPVDREIDFLSVDVEGLDLQVLQSNNWDKYRPKLVLAESLGTKSIQDLSESDISRYMASKGYSLYSKLFLTTIFSRLD